MSLFYLMLQCEFFTGTQLQFMNCMPNCLFLSSLAVKFSTIIALF